MHRNLNFVSELCFCNSQALWGSGAWLLAPHLVPALLHEGDQLHRQVAAVGWGEGGSLGQLPVLVTQRMQHLLHVMKKSKSTAVLQRGVTHGLWGMFAKPLP